MKVRCINSEVMLSGDGMGCVSALLPATLLVSPQQCCFMLKQERHVCRVSGFVQKSIGVALIHARRTLFRFPVMQLD